MIERRFGWIKDKHNPQAVYHRPKAVKIADIIDLSQYCPPVRNQGQEGSCTGFGIGGVAYTVAKMGGFASEIYSPTWLYNGARDLEGTLITDSGAAPDDLFKWATLYGLLFEHFWPYTGVLDKSAPGSTRMAEAIKYPNFQVIRVDNGVDGIVSALAEGHCVALGCPWSQRWESYTSGVMLDPNGSVVGGGHETFLHGCDNPSQFVVGENSWDTDWGIKGHYRMPFSAFDWFKANGGYDAHYIVMSASPNPITPKKKCWLFGGAKTASII